MSVSETSTDSRQELLATYADNFSAEESKALIREYVQWLDNRQRHDYGYLYPSGDWIDRARHAARLGK